MINKGSRKLYFQALGLNLGMQLGISMVVPLVIGIGGGIWLDRWLGIEPTGILGGVVLGLLVGAVASYQAIREYLAALKD